METSKEAESKSEELRTKGCKFFVRAENMQAIHEVERIPIFECTKQQGLCAPPTEQPSTALYMSRGGRIASKRCMNMQGHEYGQSSADSGR